MTNTVLIKRSSSANAVPSSGNLLPGELAINYNDGNLFYKNTSNIITVIASNQFTSVAGNVTGGNILTSGLISSGGNITAAGITSTGIINLANTSNVSLGSIGNLHIGGGTANYVLSTDGSGSLSWVAQTSGSTITVDDFTGNGVQTDFTLSVTPASIDNTTVNYDGVIQLRTSYSLVGANIVFPTPPASGSNIEVTSFSVAITGPTQAAGSNTQVQFNNSGNLGASSNFTFNTSNNTLTTANIVIPGYVASNLMPLSNVTYNLGNSTHRWNELWLASSTIYVGNSTISANADALVLTNPAGGSLTIAGASSDIIAATVSASGNINGSNVLASGLISASGNIRSGANITGGNLITSGVVSAASHIGSVVSVSGNITGDNINIGGLASATGNVFDGYGKIRAIPQNSQTSAYSLIASDVGKHISITTGGVTANASIFSAGDVVSIYNNSSSNQTITAGTNVTFRLAGSATTGNRTLAQYGVATLLCVTGGANPVFVVSGAGVT